MLMRFDPFREFDRITQALGQAPVGEPRPRRWRWRWTPTARATASW
jgi:hypothetical protein